MLQDVGIDKRQLWGLPTKTTAGYSHHCTPFTLPSNGIISFDSTTIQLTTNVLFQPQCTGTAFQGVYSIDDLKDPFYASTIPQTYVIAAATVIAWILVIMLVITPRTSFLGNSGAAPTFGNGHGIIGGATGGEPNLIGVGSRPWLQKVAALTVAVSLTIATADTFRCAREQYNEGYMDATELRENVIGSLEIRVTRVISDIFLWLAQVQTLIRLFPRHKEKVLIKWIGFALILFDSLFSCLNSFMINTQNSPRNFVDAIPALSYLFELALGLLYAAWVIYYAMTKRRYAFYHSKMRSITLIAALSLVAILTPVVFFITDVSNPDVARWGDYFRWVGAAAASVVVWEWVERIEALERDEKKDGILGREIFDGDEMLDVTPSDEVVWTHSRRDRNRYRRGERSDDGSGGASGTTLQSSALEKGISSVANRFRHRQQQLREHFPLGRAHSHNTITTPASGQGASGASAITFADLPEPRQQDTETVPSRPTPPPAIASPVSRTDTTSAASTVYVVQNQSSAPQPVRRRVDMSEITEQGGADVRAQSQQEPQIDPEKEELEADPSPNLERGHGAWYTVANPFKRKRASPPAEVQQARKAAQDSATRAAPPAHNFSPWDIKNRLGVLAAETGDKFRDRNAGRREHIDLPVTVIPAPKRGSGRAWTPSPAFPIQQQASARPTSSNGNETGRQESGWTTFMPNKTSAPIPHRKPDAPTHSSRQDDVNPLRAGGTDSPTVMASRTPPPRADDIRPGSGGVTVIPAPRRSARTSPLATFHTSASISQASDDAGNLENG